MRLNAAKNRASIPFFSFFGFNKIAARAGLNVSALNAEKQNGNSNGNSKLLV